MTDAIEKLFLAGRSRNFSSTDERLNNLAGGTVCSPIFRHGLRLTQINDQSTILAQLCDGQSTSWITAFRSAGRRKLANWGRSGGERLQWQRARPFGCEYCQPQRR